MSLGALFNSYLYHGNSLKKRFFEGWYFKFVDRKREKSFAVIPGVSTGSSKTESHSFIQFLSGSRNESGNFIYSFGDFHSNTKRFAVEIGDNHFSTERISLNMKDEKIKIAGEIKIVHPYLWPVRFYSPGIMGPFSFVPFMECYHGVVSMDHSLEGEVEVNGEVIDLSGGKGYIEKDWGRSFPEAWVWMQSNNFDHDGTSFMLSIATIPWLGKSFTGSLCAFLYRGELCRFTTYKGARINRVDTSGDRIEVELKQRELTIHVDARKTSGAQLISPVQGSMSGKIDESLTSEIHLKVQEGRTILFEGTGTNSGLEAVGKLKLKD
ncbi:MAG: hypothetical protein JW701_02930 [Kosmotogaceae bacterium]|nr:hypothetical protein [Kosmotogaceae bacterium]